MRGERSGTLYDVAILGAGAAGLMCAARLNECSQLKVCVIEGNARAGAKIRISGGGKCNVTHVDVDASHYFGDAKLVGAVLARFDNAALLAWLQAHGCRPVLKKGRYFFCPRSAAELVEIFEKQTRGIRFFYNRTIVSARREAGHFVVETSRETFRSKRLVVATGGESFSSLGATDIGLRIAESFGIETVPFRPALAGLTLQKDQFWMKSLSGVSLPVRISVGTKVLQEDMLFAHRGISGPAVLSASLYWEKGEIEIDFLCGRSLDALLAGGGKKLLSTALPLPRRFVRCFLDVLGIDDMPCGKIGRFERAKLEALQAYRFAPAGTFGFSKAEVSKGGVACSQLHAPSCESRNVAGLYFVGEVVDVTGELGGYNFQWAFASGRDAADALVSD